MGKVDLTENQVISAKLVLQHGCKRCYEAWQLEMSDRGITKYGAVVSVIFWIILVALQIVLVCQRRGQEVLITLRMLFYPALLSTLVTIGLILKRLVLEDYKRFTSSEKSTFPQVTVLEKYGDWPRLIEVHPPNCEWNAPVIILPLDEHHNQWFHILIDHFGGPTQTRDEVLKTKVIDNQIEFWPHSKVHRSQSIYIYPDRRSDNCHLVSGFVKRLI